MPSADCWRAPTRSRSRRCARPRPARRKDAGTLAGLVEKHARLAGAEEAYIAVAPDLAADRRLNRTSQPTPLAERFAVRASVAYKGCWVRRTRTFAKDGGAAKADAWFDGVVRSLEAGKPIAAQLAAKVKELARRDADKLDGRKLHRQLSAVGRRLVARARQRTRRRTASSWC